MNLPLFLNTEYAPIAIAAGVVLFVVLGTALLLCLVPRLNQRKRPMSPKAKPAEAQQQPPLATPPEQSSAENAALPPPEQREALPPPKE